MILRRLHRVRGFTNVNISANDYLIVWCDTAGGTQSGLHTTYRLSADQEEVYLTDPTGIVVDAVHFVNMPTDVAYARVPNGNGVFTHQQESYNMNNQSVSSYNNSSISTKMRVYPNPSNNKIYVLALKLSSKYTFGNDIVIVECKKQGSEDGQRQLF